MFDQRMLAYVLIAVGVVGLLARLTQDAGWLWIALVATAFLTLYLRQGGYPFLVVGTVLAGTAIGILLEGNWHWQGAFLVSLGAGVFAIDLVEHRAVRWPRWLGTVLMILGVVTGLLSAGVVGTAGFGLALLLSGAYLLWRGQARSRGQAAQPPAPAVATPAEPTPAVPTPAKPTPAEPVDAPMNETAHTLHQALRAWRSETALKAGIAEGQVLPDATLEQLSLEQPQSHEALRQVYGIGDVRLERYGDALLELLRRS